MTTMCVMMSDGARGGVGGCEFPPAWRGTWFQSGLGDIVINATAVSRKGSCRARQRDYFLIDNRSVFMRAGGTTFSSTIGSCSSSFFAHLTQGYRDIYPPRTLIIICGAQIVLHYCLPDC